jgi:hypothetical protein
VRTTEEKVDDLSHVTPLIDCRLSAWPGMLGIPIGWGSENMPAIPRSVK